jgi:hypothetical protein
VIGISSKNSEETTTQPRFVSPDSPTAEAILRTVLYGDVFSFPMTEAEIHHFLIGHPATLAEVHTALEKSAWLAEHIVHLNGYYVLRGREETTQQRQLRDSASESLWPLARRYGLILAHLPFVRMVALTGALSMRNAHGDRDDIDYLLVTASGRVWTARALAVIVVRLVHLWGIGLCPNYVLAESALAQDRQDLFTAHELAQMVPLAGLPIYTAMRAKNQWATPMLPNSAAPFYLEQDGSPRGVGRFVQWLGEAILSGPIGDAFEQWEQRRKLRKFEPESRKAGSSAQLDEQRVKGHFNDYGYPTLDKYHERLEQYHLAKNQA